MNSLTYSLEILDDALILWEDWNTMAHIRWLSERSPITDDQFRQGWEKLNPDNKLSSTLLKGTEINKYGILCKGMPEYQKLRSYLEKEDKTEFFSLDPRKIFFPRTPEGIVSEDDYTEKFFRLLGPLYYLPTHLMDWSFAKKVCAIKRRELVSEIPLTAQENYLSVLPYSSFILDLGEAVSFEITETDTWKLQSTVEYQYLIICCTGNEIQVLCVPNGIYEHYFTEEESDAANICLDALKKEQATVGAISGKRLVKLSRTRKKLFPLLSKLDTAKFDSIATPMIFAALYIDSKELISYVMPNSCLEFGDKKSFLEKIVGLLNGFSKVLYEFHPEVVEVRTLADETRLKPIEISSQKLATPEVDKEKLIWFEVPIHNVDYLKMKKYRGEIKASYVRGTEKSPHVRMTHQRTYRNKDGSFKKTIQVKTCYIHEDKFPKQGSKSGVLQI